MFPVALLLALTVAAPAPQPSRIDVARWERQARNITIIRDDWGIAHVYGRTDADAVFGAEYAQAEDDFNRIETNYINALGAWRKPKAIQRLPRLADETVH